MSTFREILVPTLRRGPWIAAGAAVVAWLLLPWPLAYRWRDPEVTSLMQYRLREVGEEGRASALRHEWVPLKDISPAVIRAVVAAEDGRFRDHRGVDWEALGEEVGYDGDGSFSWFDPGDLRALATAAAYAWTHRDELRGRSTITQQLAKNLYFTPERSLGRKAAELVVAWRLEWLLDKDRILELYLNTVELGPGLFGVEAAARAYFGTSAARLGTWEAATLAATLPHPLTSNPAHRPGRMAWRRDLILQRLRAPAGGDRSPVPAAPEEPAEPPLPGVAGDTTVGGDTLTAPPDTGAGPDTRAAPRDTVPGADTLGAPPDTGTAADGGAGTDPSAAPPDTATAADRGAVTDTVGARLDTAAAADSTAPPPDTGAGPPARHVGRPDSGHADRGAIHPVTIEWRRTIMTLRSNRFASNRRLQRAAENAPPLNRGEPDRTAVGLVQEALVDLGFAMPRSTRPDGSMDGIYGSETVDVVKRFQRRHGLLDRWGRPDGIAGRNTLHKLDEMAPVVPFTRTVSYDVPLVPQPNRTSCWAASMAMLVSYHEHRMVQPQEIADAVGLNLNTSYGWSPIRDAARQWNLREVPMTPALSQMPDLLERHGPLWMVVTGAPSHAVVLTGSDGRRYSWNDPWPPGVGREGHMQSADSLARRFGGAAPMIGSRNFQLLYR